MTVHKDDEPVFTKGEQDLQNRGFSTISFDFRGHGKSSGDSAVDFSIAGELVDLETIHTFGQNEGYTSIGLAGASFGGSIASL